MADLGPIIKWVGGKTKLLPELRARRPRAWGTYYEPFVGGGALFFDLVPPQTVLGDLNEALIDVYRAVAVDVEAVITALAMHKEMHDKDGVYYYKVRACWNTGEIMDAAERAAAFIYMNKTGYNGLWRVNRAGKLNVPIGRYTNPTIYVPDVLRAASTVLRRVTLRVGTYVETTQDAAAGDFVYFDPPYDPVSKTSNFTSYTKNEFGKDQQKALAEYAWALHQRGVYVMLSNNDTPLVRDLYARFNIDTVKCRRSVNSAADKRGDVDEVIITSYTRGT